MPEQGLLHDPPHSNSQIPHHGLICDYITKGCFSRRKLFPDSINFHIAPNETVPRRPVTRASQGFGCFAGPIIFGLSSSGMLRNILPGSLGKRKERKDPDLCIHQFLWGKYPYHGPFQATNMKSATALTEWRLGKRWEELCLVSWSECADSSTLLMIPSSGEQDHWSLFMSLSVHCFYRTSHPSDRPVL